MKLRDYQQETVDRVLNDRRGAALLALPTGAGKTVTSAFIAKELDAKVIMVTAPLNTFTNWERTFNTVMPHLPVHVINARTQSDVWPRALAGEPGVYIIGWEYGIGSVRYKKNPDGTTMYRGKHKVVDRVIREPIDWSKVPLDLAIVDESARMGSNTAKQTKQTEVVWTAKGAPHKLALSATPAGNKPHRIWSTLHFLWPDRYTAFWKFVRHYLHWGKEQYGIKIRGEIKPGAMVKSIPTFIRKTEEEIHGSLPPVVTHEVEVDLTATQRKIYEQLRTRAMAWLDEHPLITDIPAVQYMRLIQTCLAVPAYSEDDPEVLVYKEPVTSSKIEAMLDILQDLPEDEPVLIWTHSKKFVPYVLDSLEKKGYAAKGAYGGQSSRDRQDALEGLGKTHRILVATVPAIGEGTDGLQHVCATEIWLSQDESGMLNDQAAGRLRRPGQKRTINRYMIGAKNTVETKKNDRLARNKNTLLQSGLI